MLIPFISHLNASELPNAIVELESVKPELIACNNWPKDFPYTPDACFRMAHNGSELFIRFDVHEQYIMAKTEHDNGPVYTDSCVEFFITLDDSGYYYNFEFSCIGKMLLGFRKIKPDAIHASEAICKSVKRYSSLGNKNFGEKEGDHRWTLIVAIPSVAFFKHSIVQINGLNAHINVYKCGDNLTKPHFLSWKPIETPAPNFHVPSFFTDITFEE